MKYLIVMVLAALSFTGCKKSDSIQKETFLSAVLTDGKPLITLEYNEQRRLRKYNQYNVAGTQVSAYVLLDFNSEGLITKAASFSMPGDVPTNRGEYEYNASGKMIGAKIFQLQGPNPGTPSRTSEMFYNADGRLSVQNYRDKNGVLETRNNYSYFANGDLKEVNRYKPAGNQLWHSDKSVFSGPGGHDAKGMDDFADLIGVESFISFFSDTQHFYSYFQSGVIDDYNYVVLSNREMNPDGTIKRYLSTRKWVKPESDDQLTFYSFEYITK